MKIILPMAGKGSRFFDSGFTLPKPLINVEGIPMFVRALESIKGIIYSEIIFIVLKEHENKYDISNTILSYFQKAKIVIVDEVPKGQLSTVMKAESYIDTEEDMLILSSDTYVKSKIDKVIANSQNKYKGIISVINKEGEQWSFAKIDANRNVIEVAEKKRISNNASTGIYYFSKGSEFVSAAKTVLGNNIKIREEYYVIQVYQEYISRNWKITISNAIEMWDMGTPESLSQFINKLKHD